MFWNSYCCSKQMWMKTLKLGTIVRPTLQHDLHHTSAYTTFSEAKSPWILSSDNEINCVTNMYRVRVCVSVRVCVYNLVFCRISSKANECFIFCRTNRKDTSSFIKQYIQDHNTCMCTHCVAKSWAFTHKVMLNKAVDKKGCHMFGEDWLHIGVQQ